MIRQHEVVIVAGNESCDCDSAMSAIAYAIHQTYNPDEEDLRLKRVYIPAVDVPNKQKRLKTENQYYLGKNLWYKVPSL